MEKQSEVKGIIDAQILAELIGQTIYNQGKAQIFNILEAVMLPDERLKATKRLVQNILSSITKDVADELRDILGDWQIEVIAGEKLSLEEEM